MTLQSRHTAIPDCHPARCRCSPSCVGALLHGFQVCLLNAWELGQASVSHDDNTGRGAKVLADGNTCMGFADRGSVQVFCCCCCCWWCLLMNLVLWRSKWNSLLVQGVLTWRNMTCVCFLLRQADMSLAPSRFGFFSAASYFEAKARSAAR